MGTLTLNAKLNADVANIIAQFNPLTDAAPKACIATAFSGYGVSMLFNSVDEAISAYTEVKADVAEQKGTTVKLDGHNYVVVVSYEDMLKQYPTWSMDFQYDQHEIMSRAMAGANNIELLDWLELVGRANDMWFKEA